VSEATPLVPGVQKLILSFQPGGEEGEPGGWGGTWVHGATNVTICTDRELEAHLNELGKEGWKVSTSGGFDPETGNGPTRLILERLVSGMGAAKQPDKSKRPAYLGMGDER
jgi:hypothetical protein